MPIPLGYQESIFTPKASRGMEARWTFSADKRGKSLILPDGRCDVMLRYNSGRPEAPVPLVTGPATRPYTVECQPGDSWLGIRMRPHKAVVLWRQRLSSAADAVLRGAEAVSLMPGLAVFDRQNLSLASLAEAVQALLPPDDATAPDDRISDVLNAVHASGGRLRIEALATFAGCSPRHLNRVFGASIGLPIKTYAQLVQFHRTLKLICDEKLPVADASYEGGYADQPHLTRAFRRFGGFAPSRIPDELTVPALFS